jgi:hypothetical protein
MVLDFKKFVGSSATGWEDSFYGGYVKIIYDMPEVSLGEEIGVQLGSGSGLTYYLGHKLIRIFLLKIRENNLALELLFNSRIQDVEGMKQGVSIGRFLVVSPKALESTLRKLVLVDRELSSLFLHYQQFILSSAIRFSISEGNSNPIEMAKLALGEVVLELEDIDQFGSGSANTIHGGDFLPVFKIVPRGKEVDYSPEEKSYIHQLVQRLDISFDSDKDVVRGLKQGKIDTHKLAEVLANNDRIYSRVLEDQKTKPFRVVILCDESGSMWHSARIPMQYKLVKVLYGALSSIMPDDFIHVYGHTGYEQPEIHTYHDCFNQNFNFSIGQMFDREFSHNYDGPVIEKIHDRIRSITDDSILMIVISDGSPYGQGYGGADAIKDLKRIIEKCKRDNFVIMGLGFGYEGVKDIYSYHAIINDITKVVEATTVLLNKVVKTEFK